MGGLVRGDSSEVAVRYAMGVVFCLGPLFGWLSVVGICTLLINAASGLKQKFAYVAVRNSLTN